MFLFTGGIALDIVGWKKASIVIGLLIFIYKGKPLQLILKDRWLFSTLLLCIFSTTWSVNFDQTVESLYALLSTTLLGLFIAWRYTVSEIFKLTAISLGLAAFVSLVFVYILPTYGVDINGNWKGSFLHKNILGQYMILGCFSLLLLTSQTKRHKLKISTMLLVGLLMLFKSESTSAYVIFLLVLALSIFIRVLRVNKKFLVTIAMIIPMLVATLLIGLIKNAEFIANLFGKDLTFTGRTTLWQLIINKIKENLLLGYGYDAFWWNINEYSYVWNVLTWQPSHTHNGYLELLLNIGLIGSLIFFIGFFKNFLKTLSVYIKYGTNEGVWLIGFLLILLIINITEVNFLQKNSLFWIIYVASVLSLRFKGMKTSVEGFILKNIIAVASISDYKALENNYRNGNKGYINEMEQKGLVFWINKGVEVEVLAEQKDLILIKDKYSNKSGYIKRKYLYIN